MQVHHTILAVLYWTMVAGSRIDINSTLLRSLTVDDGVNSIQPSCGDGYCSTGYPVCCDGGFCVSGGDKCCASTTDSSNDMSCDQDELCCHGEVPSCCSSGQFCLGNGLCSTSDCSLHKDPYTCTINANCGWCCADNRCVTAAQSAPLCTTGPSITGEGNTCNRCYHAETCGQCGLLEGCSWCCNQQQCLPNTDPQMCSSFQRINMTGNATVALQQCSLCLGLGEGLRLVDIQPHSYDSIFGVVGGLCIVICVATLTRYVLVRRMQAHMMRDMTNEEVHYVHEQVRRYGFHCPPHHSSHGSSSPRVAAGIEQNSQESAVVPETAAEDVVISDQCFHCSASFAPMPKCRWEGTNRDCVVENYILFLSCGHGACLTCLGMTDENVSRFTGAAEPNASPVVETDDSAEAQESDTEEHGRPGEHLPSSASQNNRPQLTSKGAEQQLMRHIDKKCPKCKSEVVDIVQMRRLIASVPS